MYIEKIRLVNFRNYADEKIEFNKNVNLIIGDNAQGKTNILEAIYLCAVGKSHRFVKDVEIIFFGKYGYFIEIYLNKSKRSYKIEVEFSTKIGKRIKAGGIELKKIGELLGKLVVVMFSPDDLRLVKESPSYRRRFIDILICQLYASYLFDLQQYHKVLEQRNNLLKQIKNKPDLEVTLDIWDDKLVEAGSRVILRRIEFAGKIMIEGKKIHNKLTLEKEELNVEYRCMFLLENYIDINYEQISEKFKSEIKKNKIIDIKRGFTSVGPHRDDLRLSINGLDIAKFGSQGQQRTVVLSLKLAELEILKQEIGESPVLLLDDVFSELDENRREFLRENIKDLQVFITSTDDLEESMKNEKYRVFKVKSGNVIDN